MTGFWIGLVVATAAILAWHFFRKNGKKGTKEQTVFSVLEQMRSVGQLSVYKVLTKEIVTQTDHSWGEFGSRYLAWVLSQKKMAMIFEFAIDFRYDLRNPEFQIEETGEASYTLFMPPCEYEVSIRNIRFYDEQRAKFLPWLLPDLLNGLFGSGFSENDKNQLVDAARKYARAQALELIQGVRPEVQKSARNTLKSIGHAFGAKKVSFSFANEEGKSMEIALAEDLSA